MFKVSMVVVIKAKSTLDGNSKNLCNFSFSIFSLVAFPNCLGHVFPFPDVSYLIRKMCSKQEITRATETFFGVFLFFCCFPQFAAICRDVNFCEGKNKKDKKKKSKF